MSVWMAEGAMRHSAPPSNNRIFLLILEIYNSFLDRRSLSIWRIKIPCYSLFYVYQGINAQGIEQK
jgi:hypothetical protein